MTFIPTLVPPNLRTDYTDGTPRPVVLEEALNDADDALNKLYSKYLGRVPGSVLAGDVQLSEAKLYVKPGLVPPQLWFMAKDAIGTVYDLPVGSASTAATGKLLSEAEIVTLVPPFGTFSLPNATSGLWQDVQAGQGNVGGNAVQISFVAETSVTRAELHVPPLLIGTADATQDYQVRVQEVSPDNTRTIVKCTLFGTSHNSPNQFTAENFGSRTIATTPGTTYTWKLQVLPPSSGTAAFGVFQIYKEQAFAMRALTAA